MTLMVTKVRRRVGGSKPTNTATHILTEAQTSDLQDLYFGNFTVY